MNNEQNPTVKFGLEAQGHIPTIEGMIERMGNSHAAWLRIGSDIGWDPLTACIHYMKYLQKKQEAKADALVSALRDIENWNDELDFEWDDEGVRASDAINEYYKPTTN